MSPVSLTYTSRILFENKTFLVVTYSKTIEKIHKYNNNEENKREEENSAEMGVQWNI